MNEKKIVSIEDRIPKLKQTRKKRANRWLIFYISIFFTLISIVVYLQSPLSHIQHIEVSGNQYILDEDIKDLSGIKSGDNFWGVQKENVQTQVENHPEVKSVQVNKNFPTTIHITIEELKRVGYVSRNESYFPLLENGQVLTSRQLEMIKGDAPLLIGFDKEIYLQEMTKELAQIPINIVDLISEVHWDPTEDNPYKVLLYMNDGFQVEGSIRNFSKTMVTYPSITAQLEQGTSGVIQMGIGGAVFHPYADDTSATEENVNEIEG